MAKPKRQLIRALPKWRVRLISAEAVTRDVVIDDKNQINLNSDQYTTARDAAKPAKDKRPRPRPSFIMDGLRWSG